MTLGIAIALLSSAFPAAGAASDGPVRVEILSLLLPQRVVIRPLGAGVATSTGERLELGARLVVERKGTAIVVRSAAGRTWSGERLSLGGDDAIFELDVQGRAERLRRVRGSLTIDSNGRELRIVVETELERLVASGVAAELEHVDQPAALEAGAIAIRSFVVANRGRHASEGFDLCDNTHCLYSKGVGDPSAATARAEAAAAATRGLVLERDGHVVAGYFTACCGGRTATPLEIWGGTDAGDFESVPCTSCRASPFYKWRRTSMASAVADAVSPLVGRRVGTDAAFDVVTGPSGWVRSVVVRSDGRSTALNGDAFRMAVERRLGWNSIPSPRFSIERVRDRIVFSGGGFGHGIGLCVAGCTERARRGATRDALLASYFPKAHLALIEAVP